MEVRTALFDTDPMASERLGVGGERTHDHAVDFLQIELRVCI